MPGAVRRGARGGQFLSAVRFRRKFVRPIIRGFVVMIETSQTGNNYGQRDADKGNEHKLEQSPHGVIFQNGDSTFTGIDSNFTDGRRFMVKTAPFLTFAT